MTNISLTPVSGLAPYERRQTLSETIPALWAFIGLIISFMAIGVSPMILKDWEPAEPLRPQKWSRQTASPETNLTIEQELRAKLRAKADFAATRPK